MGLVWLPYSYDSAVKKSDFQGFVWVERLGGIDRHVDGEIYGLPFYFPLDDNSHVCRVVGIAAPEAKGFC